MKKTFLNVKSILRKTLCLSALCLAGLSAFADEIVDLEKDDEGFYKLYTLEDWNKFADAVNAGNLSLNARMYADIGTVIGNNTGENHTLTQYTGHFDGQGHKLDVDIYYLNQDLGAPFNSLGTPENTETNRGGLVENLWTTGKIWTNMKNIGGIAGAMYFSTVQNCITTVMTIAEKRPGDYDKVGGSLWQEGATWDGTEGGICGKAFTGGCNYYNCVWAGSQFARLAHSTCGICAYAGYNSADEPGKIFQNCLSITEWTFCSSNGRSDRNLAIDREKGGGANDKNVFINNWCTLAENYDPMWPNLRIFNQGRCNNVTTYDKIASGEACFMLNGDQSDIQYYQTLGVDSVPVPFSAGGEHKRVYIASELRCDGTPVGDPIYTNDEQSTSIPEHQYEDGICSVCGACQEGYMHAEDGWMTVNSTNQMKWICDYKVKNPSEKFNIRLTCDVDLSDKHYELANLNAIFDGQGHTVKLNNAGPLFGGSADNSTIRNTMFTGNVTFYGSHKGVIVASGTSNLKLENLIVDVQTQVSIGEDADGSSSMLVGSTDGDMTLNNIIVAGRIFGNCGWCGAFMGWTGNYNTFNNCAMIGSVEMSYGGSSRWNRGTWGGYNHCYMVGWSDGQGAAISSEDIAAGWLTFNMNYEDFINPVFYQTIGVDSKPTLDSTHGTVYKKADGTLASVQDADSYKTFIGEFNAAQKAAAEAKGTYKGLVESYESVLDELSTTATSMSEFRARYPELQRLQGEMDACAKLYATLQEKVNEYKGQLESMGEMSELAQEMYEYILSMDEEDPEAEDAWKFGGAQYVLTQHNVNAEGVQLCIDYLDKTWAKVRAGNIQKDADVTTLLDSPTFDSTKGWNGNLGIENGVGVFSTGNCYQSLIELMPGIYEVTINGVFVPSGVTDGSMHTAYLYANDQIVPLMVANEDEAMADNSTAAAQAFEAGKYTNVIVTEVGMDGTMQLGVKNNGTVAGGDRIYIDNIKLVYRGEKSEASEAISAALAGQVARANALIAAPTSDGPDYATYPGFPNNIKEAMQAEGATEDPYVQVSNMSALFSQAEAAQRTYINMYNFMANFTDRYDSDIIFYLNDEQKQEVNNVLTGIMNGYKDGSISLEDAQNNSAIKGLSFYDKLFGEEPTMSDGSYQIANAGNLLWFALSVNSGNTVANAVLTNDIDLAGSVTWPTIAKLNTYTGTFDGMGYTIKNFDMVALGEYCGLIGRLGKGGVLRNLNIEGNMKITDGASKVGVVGYFIDAELTNVHSYINMTAEKTATQVGGIVGYTDNSEKGNSTISCCSYNGVMNTGETATGCFGGIVGDAGYPAFANCGNYGTLTSNNASCILGGIVGTTHETSWRGFRYCINAGQIICTAEGTNLTAAFVGEVGWYAGGSVYNNYYLEGTSNKMSTGNQFPDNLNMAYNAAAFADGTVTKLLNMKQGSDAWLQGEAFPVLDKSLKGGKPVVDRGEALITEASQLSSNASDREEGTNIGALIDGNAGTFWHTDWHGVCQDQYHYLQVNLKEEFTGDITMVMTRRSSNNDHPTQMIVWGSKDGAEYTQIATLDLPFDGAGTGVEAAFHAEGVNYLRLAASNTNSGYRTFWHAAEIQLYGKKEVVKADLFDIVFYEDGTASDVSAMGNSIMALNTPSVIFYDGMGLNILDNSGNTWGQDPASTFYFSMNDNLWNKMTDGYSMECYVCPEWTGDNGTWISMFGFEEGGGTGMITDGGKWCMEAHVGGSYKGAYGTVPANNEWVHLLGVWNKDAGKLSLYQNGVLAQTVDAAGDLKKPNTSIENFYIGCDLNGHTGGATNSFQGKIAIMRLYDKPLSAANADMLYQKALTTGVSSIKANAPVVKGIFNLSGQRVSKAQKGLFIIDGVKTLVK